MSTKHPHRSTKVKETYHHARNVSVLVFGDKPGDTRVVDNATAFIRPDKSGQLYASFAECDSRDQFNRKVGRTVARRKWFAGNRVAVAGDDFPTVFASWRFYQSGLDEDANDSHLFIG
jgi:hypothetical protein